MATLQDIENILNAAKGQFRGPVYDGVHQCVAWAADFSARIGGPSFLPTPVTGGARDIYEQFAASLRDFYDRIPNTPDYVPRKGDIVVWTGMPGNQYGHIAVATGDGDTNTFRSLDQNWVRGQAVTLVNHNYNYVLGALRPKNITNPPQGGDKMNQEDVKLAFRRLLFRLDGSWDQGWVGQDRAKWVEIANSPEGKQWDAAVKALQDKAAKVDGLTAQLKSQQEQIDQLSAQLKASQANDASDAATIAKLEEELKNVPEQQHQPTEEAVAGGALAAIVRFIKKIVIGDPK